MDTTVILAQPRGSRLRADAVYVACVGLVSGLGRHPRASAEILDYEAQVWRGDPPFWRLTWVHGGIQTGGTRSKNGPLGR